MESSMSSGTASAVISQEAFNRAFVEASSRMQKDPESTYCIQINPTSLTFLLSYYTPSTSLLYSLGYNSNGWLVMTAHLPKAVEARVLENDKIPEEYLQVFKGKKSILVASLCLGSIFPFGDDFISLGQETSNKNVTLEDLEISRKGLPPRISLKGWNSLPFSEARDLVLSGGFNLNGIDGSTEPCPHVEQVQRKFYTFRGEVTDRFPEMTFSDTCYILFALDAIAPYPNLQSGIQKALAKSPDFFKNARDTLYEKLQGVSASFCGGCEKEYVEDVACTVTDMLKTWYFSLTLKAIPVKESISIPVANRSDEALLHEFQQDHPELDSIENELERRSKGKPFLVYQDDDCSILDMRNTLSFLKDCRKKEVASQGQYRDPVSNKLLRLFRISEVNWKNRIREICPLDPKSILYRGYCSACDVNFSRYSYPQRQAIAFAIRSIETKGQDYALLFKTKIIPYLQEHPDGEGIYTWLQDNGFRYLHSDLHQATVAGTLPVLTALENPISSDGITKDMHPYFRKGV